METVWSAENHSRLSEYSPYFHPSRHSCFRPRCNGDIDLSASPIPWATRYARVAKPRQYHHASRYTRQSWLSILILLCYHGWLKTSGGSAALVLRTRTRDVAEVASSSLSHSSRVMTTSLPTPFRWTACAIHRYSYSFLPLWR